MPGDTITYRRTELYEQVWAALLLTGALAVSLASPVSGAVLGQEVGSWAVFAPDITFDSASTTLSKVLHLDPTSSIYLFREGTGPPKRIVLNGVRNIDRVDVSSATGLIAVDFSWWVEGQNTAGYAVVVVDTTGVEIGRFAKAHRSRWSPDGSRLALWFATARVEAYPSPDSVGVWDAASRHLRSFRVRPYDIGWLTRDVVLLDGWTKKMDALNIRSGAVYPGTFRGTLASPDTVFSLSDRYESGVQAWDERSHSEMTIRIEALLEGGDLRAYPEPFWIPDSSSRHLLCVPACLYRDSTGRGKRPPFDCNVYVIDPKAGVVLRKMPGKGIGVTADKRGIVTLRGRTIRFVRLVED